MNFTSGIESPLTRQYVGLNRQSYDSRQGTVTQEPIPSAAPFY